MPLWFAAVHSHRVTATHLTDMKATIAPAAPSERRGISRDRYATFTSRLSPLGARATALGAVTLAFWFAARSPAQELILLRGEYGSAAVAERYDPNALGVTPLLASVAILAVGDDQRIRGITPYTDGGPLPPSEMIAFVEHDDGTASLVRIDFITATVAQECPLLMWGVEPTATRPRNMVGFARDPFGTAGSAAGEPWHTAIGEDGWLYGPDIGAGAGAAGPTSNGVGGPLPSPGPHRGGVQKGGHLHVVSQPAAARLKRMRITSPTNPFAPSNLPVETGSWIIPVDGQVLAFTLCDEGRFHALVNHVNSSAGGSHGYVELVRSVEPVDAAGATLTLESIGTPLQQWSTPGAEPLLLPYGHLAFANSAPPVDSFLVDGGSSATVPSGTSVTFSASWTGSQSAMIQPGGHTIQNGGSVGITPPPGSTTYTLKVAGLSGIDNTAHTVTVTTTHGEG